MTAIYSHRFIASQHGTGVVYTVPAGQLAVIRCVVAVNGSTTAAAAAQLQMSPSGLFLLGEYIPPVVSSGPAFERVWDVRIVINAGESFQTANGTSIDMTVSGYLLSAP